MNSELKAILRRRRRRSDGVPPSPEPERRSTSTETPGLQEEKQPSVTADPADAIRDALRAPPPPPPPGLPPKRRTGSNVSSIKNSNRQEEIEDVEAKVVAVNSSSEPALVSTRPPTSFISQPSQPPSELETAQATDHEEVLVDPSPSLSPAIAPSPLSPAITPSLNDETQEQDNDSSSDEEAANASSSAGSKVEELELDLHSSIENESEVEYEPPPAFAVAAFLPSPEKEDDKSPLESPPKRPKPTVSLRSWPLLENSAVRPTINPLTGNVIVCFEQGSTALLHEFDPKSRTVVASVPIVSRGIRRKMSTLHKESVITASNVVTLAAGIHRGQRRTRVRVVALVDYKMSVPSTPNQTKRVLVVWQWGYAANPQGVAVQSILTPPPKGHNYSPASLLVADGLYFFSGSSSNTSPCVFIAKSSQKSWSPAIVGSSPCKVTAMAVASTKDSYLAVGLSDGSIGVWDYAPGITAKRVSDSKGTKKLLLPLCKLEATSVLAALDETMLRSRESLETSDTSVSPQEEFKGPGSCNHLVWTAPKPLGGSSPLMLAAAYSNGVAVFHVSLPSGSEAHAATLEPFAAVRLSRPYRQNISVVWLHLGPHSNPCLAVLRDGGEVDSQPRMVLCMIGLPQCRGTVPSNETRQCHIRALCESELPPTPGSPQKKMSSGLIGLNSIGSIAYHCNGKIMALSPALSSSETLPASDDPFFSSLRQPVASSPSGLDSTGFVSLQDSASDTDGILFVYTLTQCESQEFSGSPSLGKKRWMAPVQRHFLCRALIGDAKELRNQMVKAALEPQIAAQMENDHETGGSSASVVCELWGGASSSSLGFVPHRIVRCKSTGHCAVLFRSIFSDMDSVATSVNVDASQIALFYLDCGKGSPSVYHRGGRDVVFLSKGHDGRGRALCLSEDGSAVQLLTSRSRDAKESNWEEGPSFRPFLGVSLDNDYSECRRFFVVSSASSSGLLLVGTRISDGQSFLACGQLIDPINAQMDDWSNMLPNLKTDPVLWLDHGEEIVSLSELPRYENGHRCIAAATNRRVFIAALDTLELLSETSARLGCGSLASLGSHTVAFCSTDFKIQYLCGLQGKFSSGVLAALPSPAYGFACFILLAVRPDRIVYASACTGSRLVHEGEKKDMFLSPTCITKPVLLLEPLIANALCERNDRKYSNELIRVAIEKFGRKVKSLAHADDEGIGNLGSGLTPHVFEMLSFYDFKHPASWLLTGDASFERTSNCKMLPPWAPMPAKAHAALNSDALLQIFANGDQYFSDYVKSPDQNMASSLPRSDDPSAEFAAEFARKAMIEGKIEGGLKLLDLAGAESSNSDLLHLVLSLQLDPFFDINKILKGLSGIGDGSNASVLSCNGATSSIAALAFDLRTGSIDAREPIKEDSDSRMSSDAARRGMRQIAPSVQRGHRVRRARDRLIGESASTLALTGHKVTKEPDQDVWDTRFNESNHIWNEGPFKERQSLMILDRMEEWLGRSEPVILGKEGAAAALERGEKTLADILSKALDYDDDSFGGHSEGSENVREGWEEGIGEGRTDEENLSAYFRMSEGADEDSLWATEGLADLTKFQHKALIVGSSSSASLQPTTSSVDVGVPGKVKGLYDLVFDEACESDSPSGLALEVVRGGSLDVGVLHEPDQVMRKRCSIEFWYHLPPSENVSEEIVLVRRSVSMHGQDLSNACVASYKDIVLWELVVLPSGELEYRTSGGSSLSSTESNEYGNSKVTTGPAEFRDDAETADGGKGVVSWQRQDGGGGWNHVCLVFSSRDHSDPSACTVSIMMKGEKVSSGVTTVVLPSLALKDLPGASLVNEVMERTVLAFCINPVQGLRITELRVWSCERSEDDCKMMMYEYLQAAEIKRKLKVKIKSKRSILHSETPNAKSRGGLLAPPPRESVQPGRGRRTVVSPPETRGRRDNAGGDDDVFHGEQAKDFKAVFEVKKKKGEQKSVGDEKSSVQEKLSMLVEETTKGNKFGGESASGAAFSESGDESSNRIAITTSQVGASSPGKQASLLWDSALPISATVRRSAAAALIRGPPATRHFGGNRGGLAADAPTTRDETKRFGVGAIAICGAEKTVVYAHEQAPPGKTYPIGASGAVISDEMDNDGSEYLCCFLAKDKRMVVFEIKRKVVVVELQMTTKLNFWRFLPPQAHGHSLVFMVVTPVGGFHWSPLDDAPRPRQVWKRGPDLQGKKIITYEEGGSNGVAGAGARSAVALLLASVSTTAPVEAWIMPVCGDSRAFCVSSDVMGCALGRPSAIHSDGEFLPYIVTAKKDLETDIVVEIASLTDDSSNGGLGIGEVLAHVKPDVSHLRNVEFAPPPLAMGEWPEIICCCCENMVVAALRRKGLVAVYEFTGSSLELAFFESVGHFVVDAAARSCSGTESKVEVILLLCDNDNPKDGRVISISL